MRPAVNEAKQARRWQTLLEQWPILLLLLPVLLVLVPIYLLPIAKLFLESLNAPDWTVRNYASTVFDRALLTVLFNTFTMALQVAVGCLLLGYPIAFAMLMAPAKWRSIITILVLLPLWTSVLIRSYAWIVILGRNGLVNQLLEVLGIVDEPVGIMYTRFAVLLALIQVMLPIAVLPIYAVMKRVDLRLIFAANALGASRARAMLSVFFPLTIPGVASSGILIFILSIGFFVTPMLLGGLSEVTFIMLIERQVNTIGDWGVAAAMSMVLLFATIVLVIVFGHWIGLGGSDRTGPGKPSPIGKLAIWLAFQGTSAKGRPRRPKARNAGSLSLGFKLTIIAILGYIAAPILVFFPLSLSDAPFLQFPPPGYSLRWYRVFFTRPDWTGPLLTSVKIAIITMVLATALGLLFSVGLSRFKHRLSNVLMGLAISPAIVPQLILAVGLYFELARYQLVGSLTGMVLGHLLLALPVVITILVSALNDIDLGSERAARSLGAGPVRAFYETTLVYLRPSLIASALFAFLTSFDDVVMALFIAGTTSPTLPKRMWDGIVVEIDPTVSVASTVLIIVSCVLFAATQLIQRRSAAAR